MGGFKSVKKSILGGRPLGKIDASLNKKLQEVKWGEYRLGDLFEIKPTKYYRLSNDELLSDRGNVPVVSNQSVNNGVMGFSEHIPLNAGNTITCSDTTLGADTMYYQKNDFIGYSHIQHFVPKFKHFNMAVASAIISSTRVATANKKYDYGNKFNRKAINSTKINLPVTKDGEIDFDFMESFIAELSAYLSVSGFDDYELSNEEKQVLTDFDKLNWQEYKLGDLFDVLSYKKRFDANKVSLVKAGGHPYIVRQSTDNGKKGNLDESPEFLNSGNTISFGQDTATMFYQELPYFTGDKIKILKSKNERFGKKNAQFFLSSMKKTFSSFAWGSSRFNVDTLKEQLIKLPVKNGEIDFDFMEIFISAVQKLVIKDVVMYADRKIKATKDIVNMPREDVIE